MKFKFLLVSAIALSSGCSGDKEQPVQNVAAEVAPTITAPKPAAFTSPLPEGTLNLQFESRILSDRVYDKGAGVSRRGIALEYTGDDNEAIWKSLGESLAATGYAPVGEKKEDGAGKSQQPFDKREQPRVVVSMAPKPSDNPAKVNGTIWISWQLSSVPAQVSADATASVAGEMPKSDNTSSAKE